jgi:heat-inducible transcriptional repressor
MEERRMTELTSRQQTILGLVVREYVESVTPVGSRSLVDKYNLQVSSATVRNEMALLEELGYLTHPHTSAGRVPTDSGYRYFVERVLQDTELPVTERRTIAHQFQQVRREVSEWMPLAASVLSRSTKNAALVTAPQTTETRYRHLQLISTQGRLVLLILVLEGGLDKQQTLTLPEPLPQEVLSEAADRLNQMCTGLTADEIKARTSALPRFEAEIAHLAVAIMHRADADVSGSIYRDGLSQLLREPEFHHDLYAEGVLRIIEEQSFLSNVLADTVGLSVGSVRVVIGEEGRYDELQSCTLILSRYGVAGMTTGALGVLGPTRMGYGRAISAVRYISGLLSELVYDLFVTGAEAPPPDARSAT